MDEASWRAAEEVLRADYGDIELHMVSRLPVPPDEPRRRKWALAAGAVVILAMALAVWMTAR